MVLLNTRLAPDMFSLTGQVQAALPSVAVAGNGIIGVFYYTFDGFSTPDNFPIFSAHLSLSDDHAQTFTDQVLLTFLSSAKDNGKFGKKNIK